MFIVYDPQTVNMEKFVTGGNPNATVTGAIIQELDTNGNVVFQWNSIDHIGISDTNQDLTAASIDYIHTNAVELDADNNILISKPTS